MKKGIIWEYSEEGYSFAIQWRKVQYGDIVKKDTV